MTAPAPAGREQIVTLLLEGAPAGEVAMRLHWSLDWVREVRQGLVEKGLLRPIRGGEVRKPWVPPDPWEADRRAALARGRALALAKVAAGEWVLPADGGVAS